LGDEDVQRHTFGADGADDVHTTSDGNVARHAGLGLLSDSEATPGKRIPLPETAE
jgi:hypothetical protein